MSLPKDIDHIFSYVHWHRRRRIPTSEWGIEDQQSETLSLSIWRCHILGVLARHWLHSNYKASTSVMREHDISVMYWESIRWDRICSYFASNRFVHFMQTVTTLDLSLNKIRRIGVQYLGDALKINQVRQHYPLFFSIHLITVRRHSLTWQWRTTRSLTKVLVTLLTLWKSIK